MTVEVYQKFEEDDAKQCDAERDSDDSSLKFLDAIVEALTDGNGDPLTSPDDVEPECLKDYLVREEIDTADEMEEIAECMLKWQETISDRKEDTFEDRIADGISWGKKYYGSSEYKGPFGYGTTNFNPPTSTTLTGDDGVTTREYLAPPGTDLINSVTTRDATDRVVLTMVVANGVGDRSVHFWVDTDADGLPELPEAALPVAFPPGPVRPLLPLSVMIFDAFPADFGDGVSDNGAAFLDTFDGSFHILELGPDELPVGPLQSLFSDPVLTEAGGFIYFAGYFELLPGVARFVFSDRPNVAQFGSVSAVWFDVPTNGDPVTAFVDPTQTLATGMTPTNPVRIELLSEANSASLRLTGDPGATATLSSIGLGIAEVVASGLVGDDGLTGVVAANPPIQGNNLYQYEAAGRLALQFLPRVGANISCAMNDETGDGVPERLHLSAGPARLHVLMGLSWLPPDDPVKSYAREIALEESALWGLRTWSDEDGRLLMDEDGDFAMTPVPGVSPPLYVETIADLDLDGDATEAVAIGRVPGGAGFVVEAYAEMGEPAALLTQSIDLDPAVEPDGYVVTDLNGDLAPDVGIFNATAGRMVFLINNGLGWFMLVVPGDHDFDGDVDQKDFGGFQTCYTADDQAPLLPGCGIADHDGDGDVDGDDYGLFEGCASGPAVPGDPYCAG